MTKTISQVVGEDGKPLAGGTSAPDFFVYEDDKLKAPKDYPWGPLFSEKQKGNNVDFYVTGEEYFTQVAQAIEKATKSIFIIGWQVNFDVELVGKKTLFNCLDNALKKPGLQVYVMPWLSPKVGVDTGDFETMLAIFHLNGGVEGPKRAFALPAIQQSDQKAGMGIGFAHHQKLVVIDNKYAFVGGIDLAYGRRDDGKCSLSAGDRKGSELYNTNIPPLYELTHLDQTEYLTRLELIAACFDNWKGGVGAFLTSAPMKPIAVVQDAAKPVSKFVGDVGKNVVDWWNTLDLTPEIIDQLKAELQDEAVRTGVRAAKWGWSTLSPEIRGKLEKLRQTGSAHAANVAAAVIGWLNNASLERLPPELISGVVTVLEALSIRVAVTLSDAADAREERYENLMELGRILPKSGLTLDPALQPRMPWHDVQCKIEGPSVYDLSMNFVKRWNSIALRYEKSSNKVDVALNLIIEILELLGAIYKDKKVDIARPKKVKLPRIPAALRPVRSSAKSGTCSIQVLRSAPKTLLLEEAEAENGGTPLRAQDNCLKAMVTAIAGAQRFIYIEGQFFQSNYGEDGGLSSGKHSGPMGAMLDIRQSPAFQSYATQLGIQNVPYDQIHKHIKWEKIDNVVNDVKTGAQGKSFIKDLKNVLTNLTMAEVSNKLGKVQTHLENPMLEALVQRITGAINDNQPFHVYLVLPVHPEGTLNTLNIMNQMHLTMQSLVFGNNSLVNSVRRAILVARLRRSSQNSSQAAKVKTKPNGVDGGLPKLASPIVATKGKAEIEAEVNELDLEKLVGLVGDEWRNYLTLLNLRNWETIGGRPVTEQIYVHSKLLIADDRVAVLGSANINDRSQLGDRDSELAVIIDDDADIKLKLNGVDEEPVSAKVSDLRQRLWKKIFGLMGSARPASELASVIQYPAAPATWKAIQTIAQKNAFIYEAAFQFVPRSYANPAIQPPTKLVPKPACSLWPTWRYKDSSQHELGGSLLYRMPFDASFWQAPEDEVVLHSWDALKNAPEKTPQGIKGFIVALPDNWTYGENNIKGGMNIRLIGFNNLNALPKENESQLG